MTTIAYDGEYIATDGRKTWGDTIVNDDTIKFHENEKYWFALCGPDSDIRELSKSFVIGGDAKLIKDSSSGIAVDKQTRQVYLVLTWNINEEKIYCGTELYSGFSGGSGAEYALTAMDCGLNAMEAVKKAVKRDINSGGQIRFMAVSDFKIMTYE